MIQPRFFRAKHRSSGDGESGQGLAEYGLVLAFVALVCIAALRVLGDAISGSDGFRLFELF